MAVIFQTRLISFFKFVTG